MSLTDMGWYSIPKKGLGKKKEEREGGGIDIVKKKMLQEEQGHVLEEKQQYEQQGNPMNNDSYIPIEDNDDSTGESVSLGNGFGYSRLDGQGYDDESLTTVEKADVNKRGCFSFFVGKVLLGVALLLLFFLFLFFQLHSHAKSDEAINLDPNYQFCKNPIAKNLSFCDSSLSVDARVDAFLKLLTLDEKISLLSPDDSEGNNCDTHPASIPRLGLGSYMYLTETLDNVDSMCPAKDHCTTIFPGSLGHAASFNRSSFYAKGKVISTELRAFRNVGGYRKVGTTKAEWLQEKIGLTGYAPNLNILRDPRFGRSSELPGEDPYLSGIFGAEMVNGMQERDENGRPRMLTLIKHFTAYSAEEFRGEDDHSISQYDLFDTYLRQYEITTRLSRPAGAMCSYPGVNGQPSCANNFLLNEVFRKKWNQPDAIISTDCGAVNNLFHYPAYAPNVTMASAWALNNGTDLEMGSTLFSTEKGLINAIQLGLVTEERINESVRRLYKALFRVGLFDEFGTSSYDKIGLEAINSTAHRKVQYEVAIQSPVLLRNDQIKSIIHDSNKTTDSESLLPLSTTTLNNNNKEMKLMLVGPFVNATNNMYDDYATIPGCFGTDGSCVWTFDKSIKSKWGEENLIVRQGVDFQKIENKTVMDVAISEAKESDIIILAVGTPKDLEHEMLDRHQTDLPLSQQILVEKILSLNKPTIVVLFNAGQLAIDEIVNRKGDENPIAIIEAFNPNQVGTRGLVDLIFGEENRWGKLPYTMYPSEFQHQVDFFDFDMTKSPGRTYRYFEGEPLFPFGFGLSYTKFELVSCTCGDDEMICAIKNVGKREGDEVLQIYHTIDDSLRSELISQHPVPKKTLVDFERVSIASNQVEQVKFKLTDMNFKMTNIDGERYIPKGKHQLVGSLGSLGGSKFDQNSIKVCTFTF